MQLHPILCYEKTILRLTYDGKQDKHIEESPKNYAPQLCEWFDDIIVREMKKSPRNANVRYLQWCISSSSEELFTIDGNRFDKIMVIITDEIHYMFYNTKRMYPNVHGSDMVTVSYCSCCITTQYESIVEAVKKVVNEKKITSR